MASRRKRKRERAKQPEATAAEAASGESAGLSEQPGGVGGDVAAPTIWDDRWKRRRHARTICRLMEQDGLLTEKEVETIIRGALPVLRDTIKKKNARGYAAVMRVLQQNVAMAQKDEQIAAGIDKEIPPVVQTVNNVQVNVRVVEDEGWYNNEAWSKVRQGHDTNGVGKPTNGHATNPLAAQTPAPPATRPPGPEPV